MGVRRSSKGARNSEFVGGFRIRQLSSPDNSRSRAAHQAHEASAQADAFFLCRSKCQR